MDRKLLGLLSVNPRVPVQELARTLGVSRQAVHHRMHILSELGVFKGTTAAISMHYFHAVPIVVFGPCSASSTEEILVNLGESELTRRVLVAGGNFVYAVAWLRDLSELEGYVGFVRKAAGMKEPTAGIYSLDPRLMPDYTVDGIGKRRESQKKLSPLDLHIVASLADDARRPLADVAAELGVSSKTVQRHLDAMIAEDLLELHAVEELPSGGDMLFLVHVTLRAGVDQVATVFRLLSKYRFRDAYVRAFTNLPGLLIWVFWSSQVTPVREALEGLAEDDDVLAALPNLTFAERIYRTWRDRPFAAQPQPSPKVRNRRADGGVVAR